MLNVSVQSRTIEPAGSHKVRFTTLGSVYTTKPNKKKISSCLCAFVAKIFLPELVKIFLLVVDVELGRISQPEPQICGRVAYLMLTQLYLFILNKQDACSTLIYNLKIFSGSPKNWISRLQSALKRKFGAPTKVGRATPEFFFFAPFRLIYVILEPLFILFFCIFAPLTYFAKPEQHHALRTTHHALFTTTPAYSAKPIIHEQPNNKPSPTPETENKKTLTILYPMWKSATAGISSDQFSHYISEALTTVEKKLNVKLKTLSVGSSNLTFGETMDELVKKFKTAGDITITDTTGFLRMKKAGISVYPLLVLELNGKRTMKECVYVRKDSAFRSVKDLRGLTVTSGGYQNIRQILFENGIDEPVLSFFGKTHPANDFLNNFYALIFGNANAYITIEYALKATKIMDATIGKKVKTLYCSEFEMLFEPFFVAKKGANDDIVKALQEFALNAAEEKDFKKMISTFKMTGIKFKMIVPDIRDIENRKKLLDDWEKRGWNKEAEENKKYFGW